ncbi:hypothetical protein [Nocardia gamkensis]|uniref:hypothetical protein n=1 Tax=Nocardia gamkensis TaxID=352869 RepID=UPI003F4CE6D9
MTKAPAIPYRPPARLSRSTENISAPTAVDKAAAAHEAFARLAPLLAARRSMRLWNPSLNGYNDRARTLTRKLPDQPAAVPIYRDGRTRLLAACAFGEERGQPVDVPGPVFQASVHGAHHDSVAEPDPPQRDRRQQMRKGGAHG